ncbi:MAG: pyridoxamine 5'-phosphate oxidase family protein [Ottowia sp.]|uniref:pyridoxamine 5'-phosphate oxidase family protein n=1 Tax=Ottowia sp. TaxID=1898956 RepID=UPI0039E68DEC
MTDSTDPREKLWKLIKDIRFGMLTHRGAEGELHSHPLTTQNKELEDEARLYFFISRQSEIYERVVADANVGLAYANPEDDSYVSLSGLASIDEDMDKKRELFNTLARAWFPGGVDDPDVALLVVDISHAEYWDMKESQTVQLIKMAKAALTGKKPQLKADHREIAL